MKCNPGRFYRSCRVVATAACLLLLARTGSWLPANAAAAAEPPASTPITNFSQLYGPPGQKAQPLHPVRVRAVVLMSDPGWGQLYFHDGHEAAYFSPRDFPVTFAEGELVEITGAAVVQPNLPSLTNGAARILGPGSLPAARSVRLPELVSGVGQWVEINGYVRVIETTRDRLGLLLREGEETCLVYVLGPLDRAFASRLRLGSRVSVRGINASKVVNGRLDAPIVYSPGVREVRVLAATTEDLWDLTVVSIDALLNQELGPWTNRPVRINGAVTAYAPGEFVMIKDPTGVMKAQVIQVNRTSVGQRVNVWGFLTALPREVVLKDAFFEQVSSTLAKSASPGEAARSAAALPPPGDAKVLTQVVDIMKLSKEEIASHPPVRLRGVVTSADPEWHSVFFQDQSRGIYIDTAQENLRAGQWVEVVARVEPGGFAPQLGNAVVEVLGTTNFPAPVKVTLEDLANGHLDARWIEMEGVVRQVSKEAGRVTLNLMGQGGRFAAIVADFNDQPAPNHLIGALVSIRGACGSDLNSRGQLSGITLHTPAMDQITIVEPVPKDPFGIPSTAIETVATFDPDRLAGRRVKVTGMVTRLASNGFFIQNGRAGMRIIPQKTNHVAVGEWLDVLGFPAMKDFSPILEEAIFRQSAAGASPVAQKTTAQQILLNASYDATLVELQAQLLQNVPASANPKLIVQDGPIIFTAQLSAGGTQGRLPRFKSGSVLRMRGVCAIQAGEKREPESFRLLMAVAGDVLLLKAPSWWTSRNTALVVGGMLAVIGGALAWVGLLRSQVRQRTEKLNAEINERKQIEEALRASQTHLQLQFEHMPIACITSNSEGRVTSWNPAAWKIFGYTASEALGRMPEAFLFSKESPSEPARRAVVPGEQGLRENRTKDGRLVICDWTSTPLRGPDSSVVSVLSMVQDVTERKRVEEALQQSEERVRQQLAELEAIYATTPLGLCVLDTSLRFRRINQRLAEINGVPVADNLGRTFGEVVPALSQQAEAALRRVLETGETTRSEFRGETRAQPGVERIWDETWYPLRDSTSRIVGVGVVAEEITARKKAEEQMRASLLEKEILLKEIHHRVKNNIQVISSLLSLQIEHRDNPALRTVLSDVRDRVRSMALVHEQLYSSTNLAQVDLAEYARRLMKDLFRSHGALASKISLRLEAHSVNVGVDVAVPYGLILNELATNALKHAFVGRESGEILIETHAGERGEIHLRFADNGVGFPANLTYHQPRSLGLRLVQMLTGQLNGTLQMHNGAGTDVRLTLASAAQVHADA